MPSTYTLNNGIELIATGEQSGTWGDTTNTNLALIDTALDGQVTVTLASAGTSGAPNALAISDGAASNGRNRMIIFADGGDLGATAYVQLTPNDAEKIVYIRNNLSASRSIIVFQGTYNASNDYEIPAGTTAVIFFNGGGSGAVAANVFNNAYFDSLRLGGVSVTAILDEDNMASNSATALATQQSIKAYVDAQVASIDTLSEVLANGNTTGGYDIVVQSGDALTTDLISETTAGVGVTVDGVLLKDNGITATGGGSLTGTWSNLGSVTTVDINGGTIDGAVIGGSSAAAGTFTTVTASGDLTIADKIVHSGDTNTSIRFPAADTVTVETSGVERLRVTSAGDVGIGATPTGFGKFEVTQATNKRILTSTAAAYGGNAIVGITDAGAETAFGIAGSPVIFATNATERLRIDASGNVGIGTSSPQNGGSFGTVASIYNATASALSIGNASRHYQWGVASSISNALGLYDGTAAQYRMIIDASGNLGLGVTPSAWSNYRPVQFGYSGALSNHVSLNYLRLESNSFNGGGGETYLQNGHATKYAQNNGAGIHAWFTAPSGTAGNAITFTQAMTLDASGNLGVGVTAPAGKLHVAGSVVIGNANAYNELIFSGTEYTNLYSETTSGFDIGTNSTSGSSYLRLLTENTERARIDASGNLGLGVTPSAWGTGTMRGLQVASGAAFAGDTGLGYRARVMANAYYDGSIYRYIASAPAVMQVANGNDSTFQWFNASAGTAGNPITFTQAMTLDASGNLLVGTTSQLEAGAVLNIAGGSIAHASTQFNFRPGSGVNYEFVNRNGAGFDFYTNNASVLAARIDASGNLLVGTTVSQGRVTIVGSAASSKPLALDSNASYAEIQSYNSGPLYLNRQGNDVIVNSGGGNLLVGTTSQFGSPGSNGRLVVLADGSNYPITTKAPSTGSYGQVGFYNPNGVVGSITTSSSSTAYNTTSDYRLKENVQPMQNALDTVAQLNPVTYTWKVDGSAGQGFIAHELQAVVPDCVTGEKDAVDAEGNPQYQGVDTSFLVATLVKAIQELKAEVDSLRAQLNP